MILKAKEFADKWKLDVAQIYKMVDREGMPCKSRYPLRIDEDEGAEFMKNRVKPSEQKKQLEND